MLTFQEKYKGGEYSQNGEAGILDECIKRIKLLGNAVEFGAPTMKFSSNIYHLRDYWRCHFFDIDPKEEGITRAEITPYNINDILPECKLLSIDIDGNDYAVWEAYKGSPDIVVIEVNSSIPPTADFFTANQGSGYKTMLELGIRKGYFLLCHTGNMIFILNKHRHLFSEVVGDGLSNYEQYFNKSWI